MYREMSDNWYRIAPISFIYQRKPPRSEYISRELQQFYFNGQPISSANRDGLAHVRISEIIAKVCLPIQFVSINGTDL